MAVSVTYPGVYVEELPSGQHSIAPVSTSIAAFIGRAPVGSVEEPLTIYNFGDFQRFYGGVEFDYPLSYAVQDFFANGGSEAIIARLFEPSPGEGDGVARLKFAPSPPILPDGWRVGADAKTGDTIIKLSAPEGGSLGEPNIGQVVHINNDMSQKYLVTKFTPAQNAGGPNAMTILPALSQGVKASARLEFGYGPSASSWQAKGSGSSITLTRGTSIPKLGDSFTIGNETVLYTIIAEPEVTGENASDLSVTLTVTPKVTAINGLDNILSFNSPIPFPMPTGWEIKAAPNASDFKGGRGAVEVVKGQNMPLTHDQFTVGKEATVYIVTKYTAATSKAAARLEFETIGGVAANAADFYLGCALRFTRPAPKNYSVKSGPKIGETSFTYEASSASIGVVDIGDTFRVSGDSRTYSVRYVDEKTNRVYFLPEAATAFSSSNDLTFYPPLALEAANPGLWGNRVFVKVDMTGITDRTAAQFQEYDLTKDDLFNITVTLENAKGKAVTTERFLNLAVKSTGASARYPNRIDRVLEQESMLVRVAQLSATPPANGASTAGIGGGDGIFLTPETYLGNQDNKTGIYMLEHVPIFNLLCIPPDHRIFQAVPKSEQDLDPAIRQAAASYCADRRAFYIVDPPAEWAAKAQQGQVSSINLTDVGITGQNEAGIEVGRNAAIFFPRIWREDIKMKSQPALFAPCGAIAGVMAATDAARGVWKAPAGADAGLAGVTKLEVNLTDDENGLLNPLGINCLRTFPTIGSVIWGGRTLRGADVLEDDYKYISVRRLALFIEDSVIRGTQWAVFEPNDEALWSSLRLSVDSFLSGLSNQGAFYDYTVTCDATTTTQVDIEQGNVNILIEIAPVKPAEFVVLKIQQHAGRRPS